MIKHSGTIAEFFEILQSIGNIDTRIIFFNYIVILLSEYVYILNTIINDNNISTFNRYKLNAIVDDNTASASFLIFGRLAADLIGLPASTLANSYKDRYSVPPLMTRIYGIERIFQVVISNKIEDPYNLSFKVMHIFKKDEIPTPDSEEKTKTSSTSSILLHRPLANDVCKIGKRSIDFEERNPDDNAKTTQASQMVELPPTSMSIGQLEIDLFSEESPLKKSCSRFFIFFSIEILALFFPTFLK